jgi:predicted transport protein
MAYMLSEVPEIDSTRIVARQASGMRHFGQGKSEIKIKAMTKITTDHPP